MSNWSNATLQPSVFSRNTRLDWPSLSYRPEDTISLPRRLSASNFEIGLIRFRVPIADALSTSHMDPNRPKKEHSCSLNYPEVRFLSLATCVLLGSMPSRGWPPIAAKRQRVLAASRVPDPPNQTKGSNFNHHQDCTPNKKFFQQGLTAKGLLFQDDNQIR